MPVKKLVGPFVSKAVTPEVTDSNMRWRYRRKLVIVGFSIGVIMILFGMATFWWDRNVSSESIIGGVAIVVALLGAYTGFATYDDVKISQETHFRRGQNDGTEVDSLHNENEDWDG